MLRLDTRTVYPPRCPPPVFPMRSDWQTAYRAALREQDPAKIAPACEHARVLIHDTTIELVKEGYSCDSPERAALEEALRQLYFREHRRIA